MPGRVKKGPADFGHKEASNVDKTEKNSVSCLDPSHLCHRHDYRGSSGSLSRLVGRKMKRTLPGVVLLCLLFPSSMGSVAIPPRLIMPNVPLIQRIMRHHGTLWMRLQDDHWEFVRQGYKVTVKENSGETEIR